ncbi:MAG TPA: hypothetical protein VHV78_11010 [Gemmatimonadaceae bacterium]|jgi:hypothetical protein|nr:hypothetical protein [Gemmatimonadaceae bacterium]
MAFDGIRRSFDELLQRATRPEERRVVASRMKETLVQARMGLDDLRGGLEKTRVRLGVEEKELETVSRRRRLAEGIDDRETVEIAAKYEAMQQEKVSVLRQKIAAQEAELALAERDVAAMGAELKAVLAGTDTGRTAPPSIDTGDAESDAGAAGLSSEIDSLRRSRAAAERDADAARRLEELKRKMGM